MFLTRQCRVRAAWCFGFIVGFPVWMGWKWRLHDGDDDGGRGTVLAGIDQDNRDWVLHLDGAPVD